MEVGRKAEVLVTAQFKNGTNGGDLGGLKVMLMIADRKDRRGCW